MVAHTQSPCNTGKSNFHASYSWGETAHVALAPNSVFSEVMVEKKSLDSANDGGGSILESLQKKIRCSGCWCRQAASSPKDP